MARKYDSEETKQKILSSSVRLFIEKGYHETTMTEILHDAGVSGSSFHSIFHTKDGVLAELTEFMFENQFGVAEKIIGTGKNPVLLYAVETYIQLTLTEMNEHLRDIYMEAYTQPALMDYIHKHTAKKIAMIFRQYNKDFQESDFYEILQDNNRFFATFPHHFFYCFCIFNCYFFLSPSPHGNTLLA